MNTLWLFWISLSFFSYGVELFFLSMASGNVYLGFFSKHLGCLLFVLLAAGIWVVLNLRRLKEQIKLRASFMFERCIFLSALVAGLLNTTGNILLVAGYHYAEKANASAGAISALMFSNVLISWIGGIAMFKEKQVWQQYFGSLILIASIIGMSFSKKVSHEADSQNTTPYILSIICILLASAFWGSLIIICRLVKQRYPNSSTEDFSYLMTFFSGLSGVLFGVPFLSNMISTGQP